MSLTMKPLGVELKPTDALGKALVKKQESVQDMIRTKLAEAEELVEQMGQHKLWTKANEKHGIDRERAIAGLIDKIEPAKADEIRGDWDTQRRLGAAVHSYRKLAQLLATTHDQAIEVMPAVISLQLESRLLMLKDIATVENALKAAGSCSAVSKFPLKQLTLLRENLSEQIDLLKKADVPQVGRLLDPAELDTGKAAAALGRLLGDAKLGGQLFELEGKAKDKKAYSQNLGSLALLVDQASSAPDYSMTRTGDHYPTTRIDYRLRHQDPFTMYLAEARLEATSTASHDGAKGVVGAKDPEKALETLVSKRFLTEIGVSEDMAKGWKPSMKGIREALEHELILPLRALNECVQDMAEGGFHHQHGHYEEFRQAVSDMTRAVFEGNYREWRHNTPTSQKQMAVLDPKQRESWMGHNVSIHGKAPHGGKIKTREEDGLDLFWITKIGGPSHGFDRGPHCLMPLLCNARSRAIVVEDSQFPEHPAARAYLRLLSTPDGKPTLFLEPLQRDFGHRGQFQQQGIDFEFLRAIVKHAIAKANELGVPLSMQIGPIDAVTHEVFEEMRKGGAIDVQHVHNPKYVLAASGGVVEASDTLSDKHDWVQNKDEITDLGKLYPPGNQRLVYTPKAG